MRIVCTFLSLFLLVGFNLKSQTSSVSDGDWSTGGNWTAGVPEKDEAVTITNNMDLDTDFEIDDGGDYFVNGGTITDNGGGYKITHQGSGDFEIAGNVTIGGDYELKNNANLTIKGCDTLRVGGDGIFENNGDLIIEPCAVLIVTGDLNLKNNFAGQIDGQISVGGDLLGENSASLSGDGNIEVAGSVELKNSSDLFGSTSDCGGSCEYGSGQGLPIQLVDFKGSKFDKDHLQIDWSTVTELNNEYFKIEISADGYEFKVLAEISGAGTSQERNDYSIVRMNPFYGSPGVYLKLTQYDYDGKYKAYDPIYVNEESSINRNRLLNESLIIYPNPNNGDQIGIATKEFKAGNYTLQIIDISGRLIEEQIFMITDPNSEFKLQIRPSVQLNAGFYLMRITSDQFELSERFSVQP